MLAVRMDPRVASRVDSSDVAQEALAEAGGRLAGIPRNPFTEWLEYGKKSAKGRYKKYRLFLEAIHQAVAQARLTAEIKAHDESPLDWLKQGPGKEKPASPGWSTPVKPSVNHTNNT